MNTLIVYTTKHGSSKECAEALSKGLKDKIDLCNLKENTTPDLSQYETVIIGGSIYAGRVQKELSDFCSKNINKLKEKKIGLYICCMNNKEAEKQLNAAFPKELLDCAFAKKNFGGQFKLKEMNFIEKLITKFVSKALAKEDSTMALDTKNDVCMLSQENIAEFIKIMNMAS